MHFTCTWIYRLSDNFFVFFGLISTNNIIEVPNLITESDLVYTFIIQSFISCRQSMSVSHMSELVHFTCTWIYRLSDNYFVFFGLISTNNIIEVPNLIIESGLVYTFIIQSFISYRQSMSVSHMSELVHFTCTWIYRLSDNFFVFFGLISTNNIIEVPNLITESGLVYTFIIQSFISYRQSMSVSHVSEHVHFTCTWIYRLSDNFFVFFGLISTNNIIEVPNLITESGLVYTFIIQSFISYRQSMSVSHMSELVHFTCTWIYRLSDNFFVFFGLISTNNIIEVPNLITESGLVYTFIIQSFISYRQSMSVSHVSELVHFTCTWIYRLSDNFFVFFGLISTNNIIEVPNLITESGLVYTFIIQGFISCRQSTSVSHVSELVHFTCTWIYRLSDNYFVFFGLISTNNIIEVPNLITESGLVYTFIIQSFISYRQSMSVSHVSEHVHFTCTWIYRLSDNFFVFFGLISTNNIIEVPNLIIESGLVYTFIIQSFISYRQSMSVSHVSELVHFTCTWIYRLSDNFFVFFGLISTNNIIEVPNLITESGLVYTFIIQGFISCRQSMSVSHMSEHVHFTCTWIYRLSDNFFVFFGLISTNNIIEVPNLITESGLVYTFIIQSFISYRQSMSVSHVSELVHFTCTWIYRLSDNFFVFFGLISTNNIIEVPNLITESGLVYTFIIQSFISYRQSMSVSHMSELVHFTCTWIYRLSDNFFVFFGLISTNNIIEVPNLITESGLVYTFIIQGFISYRQSMSVSHMSELVHFTCTWIYRLSDNFFVFFGLISTNNIIEVPNLITESGLVYTFIIQSFISYRQSMSVSHMSELVHFTCTWIYRLSDNYFVFFGLISTNNIIEVPNLIIESGLVYTFIIQSFISYRQSMSVSHMSELVHFTCTCIHKQTYFH